jgi:hypothetical protein
MDQINLKPPSDGFSTCLSTRAEIVTVAGVEPHARGVPACHDAEAVVLDLVEPFRAGRRLDEAYRSAAAL